MIDEMPVCGHSNIKQVHWEELLKEARDLNGRLRTSHDRLLAAAKRSLNVLRKMHPHPHADIVEALCAAIAAAEELKP